MTLVLCLALVAGGTYALFSDQVTLATHLKAGTLDITLKRTKLVTTSLDAKTGFLVEEENEDTIDFSKPYDPQDPDAENKNVFDIDETALIVPGCKYTATMQIENKSDVAFGYWLEIVFDDKADLELADQLEVTVTTVKGTTVAKLSESAGLIGNKGEPVGILAISESELFTISVEFLNDDKVNNDAKTQSLDFDLIVHAVQITSE